MYSMYSMYNIAFHSRFQVSNSGQTDCKACCKLDKKVTWFDAISWTSLWGLFSHHFQDVWGFWNNVAIATLPFWQAQTAESIYSYLESSEGKNAKVMSKAKLDHSKNGWLPMFIIRKIQRWSLYSWPWFQIWIPQNYFTTSIFQCLDSL